MGLTGRRHERRQRQDEGDTKTRQRQDEDETTTIQGHDDDDDETKARQRRDKAQDCERRFWIRIVVLTYACTDLYLSSPIQIIVTFSAVH